MSCILTCLFAVTDWSFAGVVQVRKESLLVVDRDDDVTVARSWSSDVTVPIMMSWHANKSNGNETMPHFTGANQGDVGPPTTCLRMSSRTTVHSYDCTE